MNHHMPKRARTIQSGACSHCVRQRQRCYIGVKGVPCSTCRRHDLACDARVNNEVQSLRLRPPLIFCAAEVFASHLRKAEREQPTRNMHNPALSASNPLENYISIADQLLGPSPPESPEPAEPLETSDRDIAALFPAYISTPPSSIDEKSIELADNNDGASLFSRAFRAELLKSYILWVHPQVPMLDLQSFLGTIAEHGDSQGKVSLLLLHAVMLAALTFVDLTHIHREGYASRKDAQDSLYQKIKTLLDLDHEKDSLTTIQALLLLIHWNDFPDAEDARYWTNTCISLAESAGIHRCSHSATSTPARRKASRRTFWSLHNHMRVTTAKNDTLSDHSDMTMVTLNDFNLDIFSPEAQEVAGQCDVLRSVDAQKTQAIVFIEKTRLCRLAPFSRVPDSIGRVMQGTDSTWAGSDKDGCSENDGDGSEEADRPDEKVCLRRWRDRLPSAARHHYPLALVPTDWERSIYLHRTWLQLLFLGLACTATRSESLAEESPGDTPLWSSYGEFDRHLAELTDLFDEIDSLALTEKMPAPVAALLILVMAYHRRPVDTGTPSAQKASARALHRSWNMIRGIGETSDLARQAIVRLDNGAGVDLWERLASALLPT